MTVIDEPGGPRRPGELPAHGRLRVRRRSPLGPPGRTGRIAVRGPAGDLLAVAYVPEPAGDLPYRLVVLLHGAGGSAEQALDLLLPVADEQRLLLVAPQSVAPTWDLISSALGPDVERIDWVLTGFADGYPIDRMLIGGFSDGASYALSLGLANGDVFDAVLAFSPGFAAPPLTRGRPVVFVSHGTADRVLPIDHCSRRLVPRLRAQGYDVTYQEFAGGHEVPEDVVRRAVEWLPPHEAPPHG
ncbi:alpha/beta hydrolase [Actinoplanes sp. M2I2]|uniref:alpha/beta hydrolase n=1 Tax=Actinoplanes sp. M2I2 TaxID=1734444 RepID=UPI002022801A|nr:phospholipase [Actinoplanes sp. M2I2]